MTRILIAVDGSPSSLDAVRYGMGLVRSGLRATLVLAQVQEEASLLELATQDGDAIANAALEAGEHLMAPAVELLGTAGIPYETEVGLGDPAATLVDMAERLQCDSVVIGARGMNALQRAWMGSVSESVLHRSRLPVIVVKQTVDEAMEVLGEDGEPVQSSEH